MKENDRLAAQMWLELALQELSGAPTGENVSAEECLRLALSFLGASNSRLMAMARTHHAARLAQRAIYRARSGVPC
jgi:hypothetical protein